MSRLTCTRIPFRVKHTTPVVRIFCTGINVRARSSLAALITPDPGFHPEFIWKPLKNATVHARLSPSTSPSRGRGPRSFHGREYSGYSLLDSSRSTGHASDADLSPVPSFSPFLNRISQCNSSPCTSRGTLNACSLVL
jgi:hypothetical protein